MLREWIEEKYIGRQIRISGEPYLSHLEFVAKMATEVVPFGYEIGLCHDLLEDLGMHQEDLYAKLFEFKYSAADAKYITDIVVELTDVFTTKAYPELSKKKRKNKEDKRLVDVSSFAQTVKYCDLIYNISWTLKFEPLKAQKYLEKKKKLVARITAGDKRMHIKVTALITHGLNKLNIDNGVIG